MKFIWNVLLTGLIVMLFVITLITNDVIKNNSDRIEKLERRLSKNNVDTVYVINFNENKK